MKVKIVKLEIIDADEGIQDSYLLLAPDKTKLAELKRIVENRFDYQYDEDITDEEFKMAEAVCDNIWDIIDTFVNDNFIVLEVDEVYEIAY